MGSPSCVRISVGCTAVDPVLDLPGVLAFYFPLVLTSLLVLLDCPSAVQR